MNKAKQYLKYKFDVIILCTGFSTMDSLKKSCQKIGKSGKDLNQVWDPTPEAYFGLSCPDFPNMFMMFGPNSGLATNSLIYMFEVQADHIISCLHVLSSKISTEGKKSMFVTGEAMARHRQLIAEGMRGKSFDVGYCDSWFFSAGVNWTLWPFTTRQYRKAVQSCNPDDYGFA